MRSKLSLFLLVLGLLIWSLSFQASVIEARGPMSVKIARGEAAVTVLEGLARVQSGQNAWRPLKTGNLLKGGDEVQVDKGARMEIRLPDQSALRFSGDTRFRIISIDVSDEAKTRNARVNVSLGKAWANISKTVGSKPNIEMSSRNAVCGVRGTVYRMNVEQDASVLVRVYDGEVNVGGGGKAADVPVLGGPPQRISGPTVIEGPRSVSMEEWTYIVRSMQQIRIGGDGVAQRPESFTEAEDRDAWVEWNRSLDAGKDDPEKRESGEIGWFNWFRD